MRVGDRVTLDLPLTPRFTRPDPRIDAIRGCVAMERGPLVMCVESARQPAKTDVAALVVDVEAPLRIEGDCVIARGSIRDFEDGREWPYTVEVAPPWQQPADVVFTPYWEWAGSGPTTMRVWVPVDGAPTR